MLPARPAADSVSQEGGRSAPTHGDEGLRRGSKDTGTRVVGERQHPGGLQLLSGRTVTHVLWGAQWGGGVGGPGSLWTRTGWAWCRFTSALFENVILKIGFYSFS